MDAHAGDEHQRRTAIFLALGAVTGNLWEETVWGGFVQTRLMARHGLLVGSLLTAVPFFLIHLPLAFENHGWAGTSWRDAAITWGVLLVAAPFMRYLIGMLLVDTGGSTLAAARSSTLPTFAVGVACSASMLLSRTASMGA